MSDAPDTVPAWSVPLANGGKVTLVHHKERRMAILEFQRDGKTTTSGLSEMALGAVVQLAVSRVGVPVLVDWEARDE